MIRTVSEQLSVKDLGEASVLVMAGMPLVELRTEAGVCWFVFENKEQCQAISNSYWFSDYLVDARTFRETMNRLKNRIFSIKN